MKAEETGLTDGPQVVYKKEREGQSDADIWSDKLKRRGEKEPLEVHREEKTPVLLRTC